MTDSPPVVSVNLIRAFEGPRHSTLELLWDCAAEYLADQIRLSVFPNVGAKLSHAECLNKMWEEEQKRNERFTIFTEFDFLPDLHGHFAPTAVINDVLAAEYATRDPKTKKLKHHGIPGAWYVLVNKDRVKSLDFSGGGKFNDPANMIQGAALLRGLDCYPKHYGIRYRTGEHLFWSRHLHDDPMSYAAGFHLGDIQRCHDNAVEAWVREAPVRFRRIVYRRLTGFDSSYVHGAKA